MTEASTIQERPTTIRYRVLFICFCSSVLLYLDRFCMNFAQQYVKEDLLLTDDQLGQCMSAFFFAYALFQVPSGWLTDHYGPRITMTLYIVVWSIFTALMGAVAGFVGLLLVRMASGIGQAGAYPTCASVVRRWMPVSARGRASSLIAFGGRVGGAVAPILTAALVIAFVPGTISPQLTGSDILTLDELSDLRTGDLKKLSKGYPEVLQRMTFARELLQDFAAASLQDSESVADAFNQKIAGPVIATSDQLVGVGVEKEASRLLKRSTLSVEQQQRLNRLILEALFPATIKKLYVHGWRSVMVVYGALGIPVALLFWWIVRNVPGEHPRTNEAERGLPPPPLPPSEQNTASLPVRQVLQSRSLWFMSMSQFLAVMGWTLLVTWLPRYLLEVHQVPYETRGIMVSVPLWCGWFGMLFGGWLTDALSLKFGIQWGRCLPMGVGRFAAGICFLYIALVHPGAWLAVGCFALVAVFTDMGASSVWTVHQDIGGKYTASVLGWGNMWGNLGSSVCPLLIQELLKRYENWDAVFYAFAVSYIVAGILAFLVDVREKISD